MQPRCGFVTCVRLGLSCMEAIYGQGGQLAAVLTIPDNRGVRKSGRVSLDEFCDQRGIPLRKFSNVNDPPAVAWLREHRLDWIFIIGWSQIARREVLESSRFGALGMHPTLLPEGRGRAAIPWAIIKGLRRTGVTMFKLDHGVDTGPIAGQVEIDLAVDETASQLYAKVETAHVELMRLKWKDIVGGSLRFHPQDESAASHWPGRAHDDGRLRADMDICEADRLVRATTRPYPGAFIDIFGRRLRVWAAERHPTPARGLASLPFTGGCLEVTSGEWEPMPATGC